MELQADIVLLLLHVGCQIGFMILLGLCYCKGWLGGSTTTSRDSLSRLTIQKVKEAFDNKIGAIDDLVTHVIMSQLEDGKYFYNLHISTFFYFLGFFKFSPETEKAEKTLFEELKRMKDLLAMDDKKTMLIRAFLCSSFMRNPYALRGRRKVKIVLELLRVGE